MAEGGAAAGCRGLARGKAAAETGQRRGDRGKPGADRQENAAGGLGAAAAAVAGDARARECVGQPGRCAAPQTRSGAEGGWERRIELVRSRIELSSRRRQALPRRGRVPKRPHKVRRSRYYQHQVRLNRRKWLAAGGRIIQGRLGESSLTFFACLSERPSSAQRTQRKILRTPRNGIPTWKSRPARMPDGVGWKPALPRRISNSRRLMPRTPASS